MEKDSKKSGLAIAALVLGIVGVCLSFIPIINNLAFFLGILAIIFGIIPLVKKSGKGLAIAGLVLGIAAIGITLAMQNAASKAIDEAFSDFDKANGEKTEDVLKDEIDVQLGELSINTDEWGLTESKMIVTVTNKTEEKKSFEIHIEAVDSNGKRINDDYVYANNLGAGQTQDFDIFTYIEDSDLEAMRNATFNIVEASSY